jgi:4-aminobutyrate aminotransferase-like enzyme
MIWDESQTAMGRIGEWFASDYYNVVPDMMALTKGIAGSLPMGAILAKSHLTGFNAAEEHTTFGSNPLMFASCLVYLNYIERCNVLENVRNLGSYLSNKLKNIQEKSEIGKYIGEIRCPGFFIGIELVEDRETKKPANSLMMDTVEAGKERGVIFGESMPIVSETGKLYRNILKIKPSLIITKEDCDFILEVFEESLEEAIDYL